ncbi:hypothetical protein [Streptomyces sp. NPDC005538]|uniref:hypothetical protein n=1 Tax=unclassified Streptomyces TaxID=2593676 RepID=UPI0033B5DD04
MIDDPQDLDDRVYGRAAAALAAMREPDLSDFEPDQVDGAMLRAFDPSGRRQWLDDLRSRITQDSGSQTRLEDADPDEFPFRIKEFAASYHRLVNTAGATRLLVMGPFQPPFQFMATESDAQGGPDDG